MNALALAALLAADAFAAKPKPIVPIHHETLVVHGWNRECSVAVSYLGFPFLGDAVVADPVRSLIGTLTIPPGSEQPVEEWQVQREGARTWQPLSAADSEASLKKSHPLPGWREQIRPDPVVEDLNLPELILSAAPFKTKAPDLPGPPWRLWEVRYSPVSSSCALLVYRDASQAQDFFDLKLVRVGNAGVRRERSRAHLTNALRLFERGDRVGAIEEAAISAKMAPDWGLARYHNAALLCLNGQPDPAFEELEAALALDKTLKKKARADKDFADIAWIPRFKDLVK